MTDPTGKKADKLTKSGDNFAKTSLKDKIGKDLKQLYDDVVNEDIPDDFLALLQQADKKDS